MAKHLLKESYLRMNSAHPITRENLISSFNGDLMTKCWELMCSQVVKNYSSGKGTLINKFGTFTFQSPLYSLEGTTNQVSRDRKIRYPVFLVSNDYVQGVKAGVCSDKGSITLFEQRLNHGIGIVKLNISEIAIALKIGNNEASTILDNIIRFIGEKIKSGEFINKELPGIGVLIIRNKLLAVKFNNNFIDKTMDIPQKLIETKKHLNLSTSVNPVEKEKSKDDLPHSNTYNFSGLRYLPNLSKSVSNFRPESALINKITPNADKWMQNRLNVNIQNDLEDKQTEIFSIEEGNPTELVNDHEKHVVFKIKNLNDLHLTSQVLESIVYQKSFLMNEFKKYDTAKKGFLNKNAIITVFQNAKLNLNSEDILNIIDIYQSKKKDDNNNVKIHSIDYSNMMLNLVKDIKDILLSTSNTNFKNNNFNRTLTSFNFKEQNLSGNNSSNVSNKNSHKRQNSVRNNREMKLSESFTDRSNKPGTLNLEAKKFQFKYLSGLSSYATNNVKKENKKDSENQNDNKEISLDQVKSEIITIKTIFPRFKDKFAVRMNQVVCSLEFSNMLREFSIVYPIDKINEILYFLELEPNYFSLKDFMTNLNNCKILVSETLTDDIIKLIKRIKDVVYTNGGRLFFFPNKNDTVSKDFFIKKVKSTLKDLSDDVILAVYYYITKMERDMTLTDYIKYFESPTSSINQNLTINSDTFIQYATEIINDKRSKRNLLEEEYYERFLRYKNNRTDTYLNLYDFHFALQKEMFDFTAEERDILFNAMDRKKDKIIDRDEFVHFLRVAHDPLYKLQDTIKKNNLEIEEILFRMNIKPVGNNEDGEVLDFFTFKSKMLLFNSSFTHEFIFSLFLKLKNKDEKVDTRRIIKEFNVFKKQNFTELNTDSFRKNFINYYKANADFKSLKDALEKNDSLSNGLLDKVDFANILLRFNKKKEVDYNYLIREKKDMFDDLNNRDEDYKVEDVMKFCRICQLCSKDNKVIYTKFLELVFYDNTTNNLNLILSKINDEICTIASNIKKIDKLADIKVSNYSTYDPIFNDFMKQIPSKSSKVTFNEMQSYLEDKFNLKVKLSSISLLDVDKDGYISQDDIKILIDKYTKNHYFKYQKVEENINSKANIYCEEVLSEEKFKMLVKEIKYAMKMKNLTEVGLFKKLDTNQDGFISSHEFNSNIDLVYKMSPNIKDQFFSFLDCRLLGLVDLETFKKRFKDFSSVDVIIKNDWELEKRIIDEFNKFLKEDCLKKKLTIYEIFALLDFNCDGKIDLNDFKKFSLEKMLFSIYEINNFKIERVLQHISKSKLAFLTIHDIKEYINDYITDGNFLTKEYNSSCIEKFNFNDKITNLDWINSIFEKFGLYVTENYANFENFFLAVNNGNPNSEKIKIDDFIKFVKLNNLSLKGFNLTEDELITFFTAFDAHKKSYISLLDVKSKLQDYDFYSKMKKSIKTFLNNNFKNGAEAFTYFHKENNNSESLSKKELFDGINNLFPNTYSTENILTFMSKNFNSIDNIPFNEFNIIFFDEVSINLSQKVKKEVLFDRIVAKNNDTKLRPFSTVNKHNSYNFKSKLVTPYDEDPLEKLRRLLKSSRFNFHNFFKMYEVIGNGYVNQSEFRGMIKKLNLGLTNLEIEDVIGKCNKNKEGKLSMSEFLKFMYLEDKNIHQIVENVKVFISDLKQLVYKYYANPRLAFQFNDKELTNEMNIEKFKNMVNDLYIKETRPVPNFALIKNSFEYLDLRKDGVIDLNEWSKSFALSNVSLIFI